jgi:hypothetical protein
MHYTLYTPTKKIRKKKEQRFFHFLKLINVISKFANCRSQFCRFKHRRVLSVPRGIKSPDPPGRLIDTCPLLWLKLYFCFNVAKKKFRFCFYVAKNGSPKELQCSKKIPIFLLCSKKWFTQGAKEIDGLAGDFAEDVVAKNMCYCSKSTTPETSPENL